MLPSPSPFSMLTAVHQRRYISIHGAHVYIKHVILSSEDIYLIFIFKRIYISILSSSQRVASLLYYLHTHHNKKFTQTSSHKS